MADEHRQNDVRFNAVERLFEVDGGAETWGRWYSRKVLNGPRDSLYVIHAVESLRNPACSTE